MDKCECARPSFATSFAQLGAAGFLHRSRKNPHAAVRRSGNAVRAKANEGPCLRAFILRQTFPEPGRVTPAKHAKGLRLTIE